jgi:ATP-dependent exoDNAse (exonuclease V) beta subunit
VAKLLADAHASGIVSAGEFLEYISNLRESGAREGEARETDEGAVQIMSIHAAKGLEFPVVIIGDITYERRGRNNELIDSELGVLLPIKDVENSLSTAYQLGRLREGDLESAESNRLFYVGATRAREMLILSGCVDLKRDKTLQSRKGWLAQICGTLGLDEITAEDYDEEGGEAIRLDLELGNTSAACTIYEPGYTWDSPVCPEVVEPESNVSEHPPLLKPISSTAGFADPRTRDQDRIPPQRVWQVVPTVRRPRAPARIIGSIVHKALAVWRFPGDGFDLWAEACAREEGITDRQQLRHAAVETRQLLARFQTHSLHEEMDRAERRLHEVPYTLPVDDSFENGIIDALYLCGGEWTLAEFKTDLVRNQAEFARVLTTTDYVAQTGRYVKAAELLLGQRPRALLCMLDYGGAVEVVEYASIAPPPLADR